MVFLMWTHQTSPALNSETNTTSRGRQRNFRFQLDHPMSFKITGGVGGTIPNANMAASLDDDFESDNQDYYSLLNVRKEVWLDELCIGPEW